MELVGLQRLAEKHVSRVDACHLLDVPGAVFWLIAYCLPTAIGAGLETRGGTESHTGMFLICRSWLFVKSHDTSHLGAILYLITALTLKDLWVSPVESLGSVVSALSISDKVHLGYKGSDQEVMRGREMLALAWCIDNTQYSLQCLLVSVCVCTPGGHVCLHLFSGNVRSNMGVHTQGCWDGVWCHCLGWEVHAGLNTHGECEGCVCVHAV